MIKHFHDYFQIHEFIGYLFSGELETLKGICEFEILSSYTLSNIDEH